MVPHLRCQRQSLLEVRVGLSGEPHDHIGRQGNVRQCLTDSSDQFEIALPRVAAPHRLQHARGAGLHRQMQVPAHLWQMLHRLEEARREMPRMGAREPDALDARDGVHRFEEPCEVARRIVGRLVVIDDLAEQLHLAMAGRRRLPDFRHDVGLRPHSLVPARVRDDAEAAELVAPLDDGHQRLDRIAASRDAERKGDVIVRVQIDEGRDGASSRGARLLDQHRQAPNRLRAHDDVGDAGQPREDAWALLLGHAAGNGHDGIVALLGRHLAQLPQPRVQLLFRALADAAGVDDHDVGVGGVLRRLEARLLEQPRHALGVVRVHLAAERLDEVFASHWTICGFSAFSAAPRRKLSLSLSPFRFRLSLPLLAGSRPRRHAPASHGQKPGYLR